MLAIYPIFMLVGLALAICIYYFSNIYNNELPWNMIKKKTKEKRNAQIDREERAN